MRNVTSSRQCFALSFGHRAGWSALSNTRTVDSTDDLRPRSGGGDVPPSVE